MLASSFQQHPCLLCSLFVFQVLFSDNTACKHSAEHKQKRYYIACTFNNMHDCSKGELRKESNKWLLYICSYLLYIFEPNRQTKIHQDIARSNLDGFFVIQTMQIYSHPFKTIYISLGLCVNLCDKHILTPEKFI